MRLQTPRIAPLTDEQLTDEQRQAVAPAMQSRPLLNIYRTMAHAPKALTRFLEWGAYVFSKRNSLPPLQRELVILRVGFLCRSGYEFVQHAAHARREGASDAQIEATKVGAADPIWDLGEAALLKACDELVTDHFITDATWSELIGRFSQQQCMDLVFTVGQYTQVSMLLNTFGVQLDPGQALDPDLKAY